MKTTLDNTKEIIGMASKGAGDARKELVKRFLEMKQNQEKQILEFKTNIRSRQDDNNYRKQGKHRQERLLNNTP